MPNEDAADRAHDPDAETIEAALFRHCAVYRHVAEPSQMILRIEVGNGELQYVLIAPDDCLGLAIYLHAAAKQAMSDKPFGNGSLN